MKIHEIQEGVMHFLLPHPREQHGMCYHCDGKAEKVVEDDAGEKSLWCGECPTAEVA